MAPKPAPLTEEQKKARAVEILRQKHEFFFQIAFGNAIQSGLVELTPKGVRNAVAVSIEAANAVLEEYFGAKINQEEEKK